MKNECTVSRVMHDCMIKIEKMLEKLLQDLRENKLCQLNLIDKRTSNDNHETKTVKLNAMSVKTFGTKF